MSRQKRELLLTCEERDNHQLDKELLTNRLRHLEGEIEASKNSQNEKSREIRLLEVRCSSAHLLLWKNKPFGSLSHDCRAFNLNQFALHAKSA